MVGHGEEEKEEGQVRVKIGGWERGGGKRRENEGGRGAPSPRAGGGEGGGCREGR